MYIIYSKYYIYNPKWGSVVCIKISNAKLGHILVPACSFNSALHYHTVLTKQDVCFWFENISLSLSISSGRTVQQRESIAGIRSDSESTRPTHMTKRTIHALKLGGGSYINTMAALPPLLNRLNPNHTNVDVKSGRPGGALKMKKYKAVDPFFCSLRPSLSGAGHSLTTHRGWGFHGFSGMGKRYGFRPKEARKLQKGRYVGSVYPITQ